MSRKPTVKRNSTLARRHRAHIAKGKPNCHICGKPIDYSLPYLDPWSFVVDHVKPFATSKDDTLANKKAAHRECNSKKRAREFAPIVRRSGTLD